MLLAIGDNEERIRATPEMHAICPGCKKEVIARCGNIRIWHWAHKGGVCRYDFEPETQWHLEMKYMALENDMEIEKIFDPNQRFRADIYDPKENIVTEVQHSPIPEETILARSKFYDSKGIKIRWIFDFIDRYNENKLQVFPNGEFRQKFPPKYINCLFQKGFPIYDTYFNFIYNYYDNHIMLEENRIMLERITEFRNKSLKIEFMSNGYRRIKKGNGYGRFITNLFENEILGDEPYPLIELMEQLESERIEKQQKKIEEKKLKRLKIYGKR